MSDGLAALNLPKSVENTFQLAGVTINALESGKGTSVRGHVRLSGRKASMEAIRTHFDKYTNIVRYIRHDLGGKQVVSTNNFSSDLARVVGTNDGMKIQLPYYVSGKDVLKDPFAVVIQRQNVEGIALNVEVATLSWNRNFYIPNPTAFLRLDNWEGVPSASFQLPDAEIVLDTYLIQEVDADASPPDFMSEREFQATSRDIVDAALNALREQARVEYAAALQANAFIEAKRMDGEITDSSYSRDIVSLQFRKAADIIPLAAYLQVVSNDSNLVRGEESEAPFFGFHVTLHAKEEDTLHNGGSFPVSLVDAKRKLEAADAVMDPLRYVLKLSDGRIGIGHLFSKSGYMTKSVYLAPETPTDSLPVFEAFSDMGKRKGEGNEATLHLFGMDADHDTTHLRQLINNGLRCKGANVWDGRRCKGFPQGNRGLTLGDIKSLTEPSPPSVETPVVPNVASAPAAKSTPPPVSTPAAAPSLQTPVSVTVPAPVPGLASPSPAPIATVPLKEVHKDEKEDLKLKHQREQEALEKTAKENQLRLIREEKEQDEIRVRQKREAEEEQRRLKEEASRAKAAADLETARAREAEAKRKQEEEAVRKKEENERKKAAQKQQSELKRKEAEEKKRLREQQLFEAKRLADEQKQEEKREQRGEILQKTIVTAPEPAPSRPAATSLSAEEQVRRLLIAASSSRYRRDRTVSRKRSAPRKLKSASRQRRTPRSRSRSSSRSRSRPRTKAKRKPTSSSLRRKRDRTPSRQRRRL